MKKFFTALACCLVMISCDDQGNLDQEKYIKVYREILIAREQFVDSVEANQAVQDILKKYDYTTQSFAEETMELMSKDGELNQIIDSLRKEFRASY